ncbi:sensor histidine kinase [Sphingomonas floccifaciens]|uniref:histidine kinase n=1 Tax=Sphingomonas floccifaciens TaxID=1844115 RepID=A0ABW4NBD9_9SPHN
MSRSAERSRWIERYPVYEDRPWFGVSAMLLIAALALVVREAVDPLMPPGFPYVTFFPAVIVTSFLFGARLGAVSAVVCGFLAWYFFLTPRYSLDLNLGSSIALGFYLFVVGTDLVLVRWMQSGNRRLAAEREANRVMAETRELLFRELQHRVSNNLQVAAALLTVQTRQLADEDAKAALREASRRLELIGRISRQLYDPNGTAHRLVPFLDELCRGVIEASGRHDIGLTVTGDPSVGIEPDAAIPTALIVAEAVANAIEHGFAGDRPGRIDVRVLRDTATGELVVSVEDDGHGLPDGFDGDQATSLGLRIATMLARSRGGRFDLAKAERTRATLTLPGA